MKKIAILLLILTTSCASIKKIDINSDNYRPKDFDDAERWFDEMHKR
jgi:hypothetical protein